MPTPQISTFEELQTFINTNFPDNNSGLVDPEDIRVALRSFVDIQSLKNDLMTASLSPEQAAVWQELINKLDQIQRESRLNITGTAKQANAPTRYDPVNFPEDAERYPDGLFEIYQVRTPLTTPNSWGNETVTQAELNDNLVYFDVDDGVVTKSSSLKPTVELSQKLIPNRTTKPTSEKSIVDYLKNREVLTVGNEEIINDNFNDNFNGWEAHPTFPIVFTISSGLMSFTTTSGIPQSIRFPFTYKVGVKYSIEVRIRTTTLNGTRLEIGCQLSSTSVTNVEKKVFAVAEVTSDFKVFKFDITPPETMKNNGLMISANTTRNFGDTFEIDYIILTDSQGYVNKNNIKDYFLSSNIKDAPTMGATAKRLFDLGLTKIGYEAVINETFADNSNNWNANPSFYVPFTIASGVLSFTSVSGQNNAIQLPYSFVEGRVYQIKVKVRTTTINNSRLSVGTGFAGSDSVTYQKTFAVGEITSTFQEFTFDIVPNSTGKTYLMFALHSTRNFGDTFEIDYVILSDSQGYSKKDTNEPKKIFDVSDDVNASTMKATKTYFESLPVSDAVSIAEVIGEPSSDLATAIGDGGTVYLKPITYTIGTTLDIPSNTHIRGIKGITKIIYTGSSDLISLTTGKENITFDGITFEGTGGSNTKTITVANIKTFKSITGTCGININGKVRSVKILNCEFNKFTKAGVRLYNTHQSEFTRKVTITNTLFDDNAIGLIADMRAEYNTFVGCVCTNNTIGLWIEGGNNFLSTFHCDLNGVGMVVSGINVNNDTHGSIVGSSFNHNSSYAIFAIDINNGYSFTGCHCFDGKIYIENSIGFSFQSGTIAASITIANERTEGINIISNNIFVGNYGGGTITGSTAKISMNGNRFINGATYTTINNPN